MVSWLPHGQPDLEHGPVVNREPRVLAVAREHPLAKSSVSIEEIADYVVVPLEELFPAEIAETLIPSKTPGGRLIPRLRVPYGELARRDPSNVRTQLSWWITTGSGRASDRALRGSASGNEHRVRPDRRHGAHGGGPRLAASCPESQGAGVRARRSSGHSWRWGR
jgi:hypothetical protein